jgi:hypothetical protein
VLNVESIGLTNYSMSNANVVVKNRNTSILIVKNYYLSLLNSTAS